MFKITAIMATISFDLPVKVGEVEGTLNCLAHVYQTKDGKIDLDIDSADISDVKYMGMEVKDFSKLRKFHNEMGIDIWAQFDKQLDGKLTEKFKEKLKSFVKVVI